jgi:uracil-DNA glycosylase family 4
LQVGPGGVLVVGESMTAGWIESGDPFYTAQGKLVPSARNLNRLLKPYSLNLDDIHFTNIAKCFIGKGKGIQDCGIRSWPVMQQQIKDLRPELVITLGVQTLRVFEEVFEHAFKMGELTTIALGNAKYNLLPIYHPSPINPQNMVRNTIILHRHQHLFA